MTNQTAASLIIGAILTAFPVLSQGDTLCPTTNDPIETIGTAIPSISFTDSHSEELLDHLLNKIKPNTQVVMFGEMHWMKEVSEVKASVTKKLASERGFKNLVIEMPYSYTAFLNAFITKQPGEGQDLLETIRASFNSEEQVAFLKDMQQWNHENPQSRVNILCSDFEQDYTFPFVNILLPVANAQGDTTVYGHVKRTGNVDELLLKKAEAVFSALPDDFKLNTFEFVDKQYALNVLANVASAYKARLKLTELGEAEGFPEFMAVRIEQIIDNLSNKDLFGDQINNEKTIFWGGSSHFDDRSLEKGNYYNEGAYLKERFKSKAVSFKLTVLGYTPPKVYFEREVQTELSSFKSLVNSYQECFPEYREDTYLLINTLDEAGTWILNNMNALGKDCTFLEGRKNPVFGKKAKTKEDFGPYTKFDYHIFLKNATLYTYLD